MDNSPISELLTFAISAVYTAGDQQMALLKAQIAVLCEEHGVTQDELGIAKLPEKTRLICDRLVGEYRDWSLAKQKAHMLIADLRRDLSEGRI